MKKRYFRLNSKAAVWSPRFGGLAFLILLFSVLLQRFSVIYVAEFMALIKISFFFVVISIFLGAKALQSLWMYGSRGGMKALRGIVYSLITAVPLALFFILWFLSPAVYDISTDTQKPPSFFQAIRPDDALPLESILTKQAALQISKWPEMSGRRYDGSLERIQESVLNVLDAHNWPMLDQQKFSGEEDELYIGAIAKTLCLGFISDIMIRLKNEGDTIFVDMRSASRYTPKDFGANAAFIIDFMDALDTEISSLPRL
ncbi:DUF1499 domain-containing protein [Bartonella sp. CB178]|uniref:DUF1499 domain-containing protein n=1 Tax=Bartonella sp. CB178 TaxID=3112255 RepID=UPI00300E3023